MITRMWIRQLVVSVLVLGLCLGVRNANGRSEVSTWEGVWQIQPTTQPSPWSLHTRIPMTNNVNAESRISPDYNFDYDELGRKKDGFKVKKKYKKFMLPLLIAYKLKFFALIPVMIGGLLLLTGATGLAGFFFALFAATMGLHKGHH